MNCYSSFIKGVEEDLRRDLDNKELEFLLWVFKKHLQEQQRMDKIYNI